MKILFFSNVYPIPGQPTRGTFNADLVRALRDAGNDVHCLVPVGWIDRLKLRTAAPTDGPDETTVYRTWYYPPRVLRSRYHQFMAWRLRGPFRRMTKDWKPDVIVAFWIHPDAEVARRFARSIGVPIIAMAGGSDLLVLPQRPRRKRAVARVLQTVDGVITNGQNLANAAIALGADPQRVAAFYRGVDTQLFAPGDRADARQRLGLPAAPRLLLAVGNLVRIKGIDILLDALARCGTDAPWRLALVGDGDCRETLERQADRLGIENRVTFVGRIAHSQLADWYRAADVVILTSRSEGIPNVLLEALACGTPFIATNVGGIAEITPDADWLVPPNDPEAVAAALRRAYQQVPTVPPRATRDWPAAANELTGQLERWSRATR